MRRINTNEICLFMHAHRMNRRGIDDTAHLIAMRCLPNIISANEIRSEQRLKRCFITNRPKMHHHISPFKQRDDFV